MTSSKVSRDNFLVTQLQNKEVRQQGNAKGLFKPIHVTSHLMLSQPQIRFQISIDELDTPAILVQPYHLSRSHIRQIGHQEFCVARADVTPGFTQHQGHVSNVAKTEAFGIDPIGFAVSGLSDSRYPGPFVMMARSMGHQVFDRFVVGCFPSSRNGKDEVPIP